MGKPKQKRTRALDLQKEVLWPLLCIQPYVVRKPSKPNILSHAYLYMQWLKVGIAVLGTLQSPGNDKHKKQVEYCQSHWLKRKRFGQLVLQFSKDQHLQLLALPQSTQNQIPKRNVKKALGCIVEVAGTSDVNGPLKLNFPRSDLLLLVASDVENAHSASKKDPLSVRRSWKSCDVVLSAGVRDTDCIDGVTTAKQSGRPSLSVASCSSQHPSSHTAVFPGPLPSQVTYSSRSSYKWPGTANSAVVSTFDQSEKGNSQNSSKSKDSHTLECLGSSPFVKSLHDMCKEVKNVSHFKGNIQSQCDIVDPLLSQCVSSLQQLPAEDLASYMNNKSIFKSPISSNGVKDFLISSSLQKDASPLRAVMNINMFDSPSKKSTGITYSGGSSNNLDDSNQNRDDSNATESLNLPLSPWNTSKFVQYSPSLFSVKAALCGQLAENEVGGAMLKNIPQNFN